MNENMYPNNPLSPVSPIQQEIEANHREKSNLTKLVLSDFAGFGLVSLLYGIFFCFCLFENFTGITSPVLILVTCLYFFYFLKRINLTFQKSTLFYFGAALLLGLSNCLTASEPLHFFNYAGIFLLLLLSLFSYFYNEKNWNVFHYFSALLCSSFGSLGYLDGFFKSFKEFVTKNKRETENKTFRNILKGLLLSVPLLFIVILLLSSADSIFSDLLSNAFWSRIVIPQNVVGITLMILVGTLLPYSLFLYLMEHSYTEEQSVQKNGEPVIAITFTSLLSLVYLLFCFIQIRYLFFGAGSLPMGFTYAGYARQGFFQLLFVCLLNLCLVLFCLHFYKENNILKGILTIISLCTYVMIASSALRMLLYIQIYYLSFLRVLVLWALAVISLLMAGIILSIYKRAFPLFQYGLMVVTCFYIVLSLSKPDTYIAEYNLSRADTANFSINEENSTYLDLSYLYSLSADAAPVIEKYGYFDAEKIRNFSSFRYDIPDGYYISYTEEDKSYMVREADRYKERVNTAYENMSFRKWNFAVSNAHQALAEK